jgi:hypothetical protein
MAARRARTAGLLFLVIAGACEFSLRSRAHLALAPAAILALAAALILRLVPFELEATDWLPRMAASSCSSASILSLISAARLKS